MIRSLVAATLLALVACGSKHSAKHRPAPTEVGAVTLTEQGGDAVITDKVAGFEMRLPGKPLVKDGQTEEPGGKRPSRSFTAILDNGSVVVFELVRPAETDYDRDDVHKHYDGLVAYMRKDGMTISDVRDVTLGGLPGLAYALTDHDFTAKAWTVLDPESDTSYVLTWGPADKADAKRDGYAETFRRAP
jgi:hypothetical protein